MRLDTVGDRDIALEPAAVWRLVSVRSFEAKTRLFFCVMNFDDSTASSRSFSSGSSKARDVR